MKYAEWTGDLEGTVPDLGRVEKGRVLLIDTPGKQRAAELHKKNLSGLNAVEGPRRYQAQLEAEAPKQPEPEAEPQTTEPEGEPEGDTTKKKGGKA